VSVGKGNAFYKAHSYPTKVPHPAIMRFLLHYTQPGDVVLDGFAGSGMTGVAAQACGNPELKLRKEIEAELGPVKWGVRRAILGDLSTSASFIEAGMNLPIDSKQFDRASQRMMDRFEAEYGWMYRTTATMPGGRPVEASIDYVVWSEVFTCPHCGTEVVFYEAAFEPSTGEVKETFPCTSCGASLKKTTRDVRRVKVRTLAGDTITRVDMRPVAIKWRAGTATGEKRVDADDLAVLERVSALRVPPFPTFKIPNMHMTHERNNLPAWGIESVHHFWQDRPLAALAVLWSWIPDEPEQLTRIALRFWIEQAMWGLSWMNRYQPIQQGKLGGSQVNRQMTGVYYVPSLMSECSIRYNLMGSQAIRGKRQSLANLWGKSNSQAGNVMITTGSSTNLQIPNASVDYIFVDPPFGENIYYSDLAFLIESWHRVSTATGEEAIQSRHKQSPKSIDVYADLMARCFAEFFRVLKPGRWMTVEFSNHSNDVWLRIQNGLAAAGFVVADTRVIDKEQLSYRQVTAANAVLHDLVISAYKPAEATEEFFEVAGGSADGAWTFVREHLSRIPTTEGSRGKALVVRERQADRIYERMVGYHIARNTLVPMNAAEFYAGLEQRFPVRDSMYFLPDQVEAYERFRITFKELAAQELFIRDESTAVQWLRQLLRDRPRGFADVQPLFMRELQAGLASWEDLPDLRELLEANFIVDDKSRWSVPDPKKSEHLDQLRTRALLGEFATYKVGKGPLTRFRTEAVRAGFKDAWSGKDFNVIVTVGRRLPSDVFVEDSALLHYFRNAERLAT
jgi:DNA methylase